MNRVYHLRINGEAVEVLAPVHKTLLEVLLQMDKIAEDLHLNKSRCM